MAATETLKEYLDALAKKGYSVKFNTGVMGMAGVVHDVEILAESATEGKKKTVVVLTSEKSNGKKRTPILSIISAFAISYDIGAERCALVLNEDIDDGARKLAGQYGILLLSS